MRSGGSRLDCRWTRRRCDRRTVVVACAFSSNCFFFFYTLLAVVFCFLFECFCLPRESSILHRAAKGTWTFAGWKCGERGEVGREVLFLCGGVDWRVEKMNGQRYSCGGCFKFFNLFFLVHSLKTWRACLKASFFSLPLTPNYGRNCWLHPAVLIVMLSGDLSNYSSFVVSTLRRYCGCTLLQKKKASAKCNCFENTEYK